MLFRRKRRPSLWRNLIGVLLLFGVVGGLVIASKLFRMNPVFILSEDMDTLNAQRKSPDNAYYRLEEAAKLIPATRLRDLLQLPDPKRPGQTYIYETISDSMAAHLDFKCPDDYPEFLEYLRACEPAVEKAREAFNQPYFLRPESESLFERWSRSSRIEASLLPRILNAQANAAFRYEKDWAKALRCLEEAVRLQYLLSQDTWSVYRNDTSDAMCGAYRVYRAMANEPALVDALGEILASAIRLQTPFADRTPILIAHWRMLDYTQFSPSTSETERFPGTVLRRFFLWELRKNAITIKNNRESLIKLANGTQADFEKWIAEHPEVHNDHRHRHPYSDPMDFIRDIVIGAGTIQQQYHATLLTIALERFRALHGEYPETLNALLPEILTALPSDPLAGGEYRYRRENGGWTLSCADFSRHGGKGMHEKVLYTQKPRAAEPKKEPQ